MNVCIRLLTALSISARHVGIKVEMANAARTEILIMGRVIQRRRGVKEEKSRWGAPSLSNIALYIDFWELMGEGM